LHANSLKKAPNREYANLFTQQEPYLDPNTNIYHSSYIHQNRPIEESKVLHTASRPMKLESGDELSLGIAEKPSTMEDPTHPGANHAGATHPATSHPAAIHPQDPFPTLPSHPSPRFPPPPSTVSLLSLPDGIHRVQFDNGEYQGEVKDNRRCGRGRYTWKDGNFYEGDWVDDVKHGQGVFVWAYGDKYEGAYFHDQRHGFGKKQFANGDIYEVNIVSCSGELG
jgi:hypothetical protein